MSQKRMGVGVVVRDDVGVVMAAMSKLIPFIVDPTVTESVAAWQAVQFCCELGYLRVVLEGDSVSAVTTL
jgi:collagenase-like PrtC family protease